MDQLTFKKDRFIFIDEGSRFVRAAASIAKICSPRPATGMSPVVRRGEVRVDNKHIVESIWEACDFNEPLVLQMLEYHKRRFSLRNRAAIIPFLIIVIPLVGILYSGFWWLIAVVEPYTGGLIRGGSPFKPLIDVAGLTLAGLVFLLFVFVVLGLAIKLVGAMTDKRFADTLCVVTITYILVELSRDDVLAASDKRSSLIARINDLVRNTNFLALQFMSGSEINRTWIRQHFRHIERYIRERERWAIAPVKTTLMDLRRDFYVLAVMFIRNSYGEFTWPSVGLHEEPEIISFSRRVRLMFPRFLGIVLPLILLGVALWRSEYLAAVGIGSNLVALIFIAWLLLTIDAALKLGIVAGIVNLAKEIKSLK